MFRSKRYSGFDPRTLGNCALWLDAADTRTLTLSGSNVTAWADKSSNSYTCSPVSGNTLTRTTQNGLGVVYMNNARATIPSFVWSNQYTLIAVVSAAGGSFLYSQQVGATYSNYVFTGNQNLMNVNNNLNLLDSVLGSGTKVISSGVYTIFSIGYDSGTSASNYAINGTTRSTTVVSGTAVSPGSNTVALYLNGNSSSALDSTYVAELIHYNNSITAAQRQQVEGYLAWKWGISSSFQPTSISGLSLWLDGADRSSMTLSGSNVTQWRDKSSNAYQSTVAGSPVYTRNSRLNQVGCVSFNGTTDSLLWNSFSVTQPFTAFAVCTLRISANPLYAFVLEPTLSSNAVILYTSSGPILTMWAGLQNQTTSPTVTFSSNITGVYSAIFNGTSSLLGFNGAATSNLSPGTSNWTGLYLGRDWGGIYQPGEYGEVIFYSGALSTDQRQQVEDYLSRKWNVSLSRTILNLPSSHPFRLAPPVLRPFNPTDIANCALWLDAADAKTITLSGSNVTAWADKSGNGNNPTISSSKPTYIASNRYIETFDLSQNFTVPASIFNTIGGSIFLVYADKQQNLPNYATLFGLTAGYTSNSFYAQSLLRPDGFNFALTGVDTPPLGFRTALNTTSSVLYTQNYVYNSSNLTAGVNGTQYAMTSTFGNRVITPSGTLSIGGTQWGGFVNARFYEILFFNSVLTTSQIQQVESYLANKWGLQGSTPSTHPARISPGLSPQFMPTLLSNCALWLDAADQKTLTLSGSNVTAWADKSGNGRNATVSSNAFAVTSNSGLFFNNSYYTTTYSASPANETFFCVFTMPSALVASSNGLIGTQTGGRTILVPGHGVSSNSFGMNNSGVSAGAAVTGIVANTRYIGVIQIAGTSTYASLNGNSLSSPVTITAFTAGRTTTLGRETTTTQAFNGFVHELVAFTASLSTSDRQQVEGYLATKWGLQGSLPASHPYKNTPLL